MRDDQMQPMRTNLESRDGLEDEIQVQRMHLSF